MFIHRRDYYDKNDKPRQAEIIVEKNRDGETGIVTFRYNKNNWFLEELPPIRNLIPEGNYQIPNGHQYRY